MKQKNLNETNSALLGYNGRKPIYSPDNAKHIFICGTTGSGKTVALSNYMRNCMKKRLSYVDYRRQRRHGKRQYFRYPHTVK